MCVEQKEMIVFGQHIVSTVAILEESVTIGERKAAWILHSWRVLPLPSDTNRR